jgi:hypothetical protein
MSNPFDIRPPLSPSLLAPQPLPPPEPPRTDPSKTLWALLVLAGGVLALFCAGAAAGAWLVYSGPYFEPEELWHSQLAFVVENAELPPREEKQVMSHVRRLARACDLDRMHYEDLETVLKKLEDSPVFMLMDMELVEQDVVQAPGLSAEEQRAGRRTLMRVARGVHAGKITSAQFYSALPTGHFYPSRLTIALSEEEFDSYYDALDAAEIPEASTDDFRASLARLKALADEASIADEPWTFDISDEFAKAVDRALADVAEP